MFKGEEKTTMKDKQTNKNQIDIIHTVLLVEFLFFLYVKKERERAKHATNNNAHTKQKVKKKKTAKNRAHAFNISLTSIYIRT